jgi:hypothetical protein
MISRQIPEHSNSGENFLTPCCAQTNIGKRKVIGCKENVLSWHLSHDCACHCGFQQLERWKAEEKTKHKKIL